MKKYIVLLIFFTCMIGLYLGHLHWKNKTVEASIEGRKTTEKFTEKENLDKAALKKMLSPENNKSQSLVDYLRYKAITQNKASIAVIGSNITAGTGATSISNTWPQLLKGKLKAEYQELNSIELYTFGFEGYSTVDLLKSKKIDQMIAEKPDLVIFENSIINDYSQSINLKQTQKNIEDIMSKIQKGLPNSKLLMMSPNPIVNSNNPNSINLSFLDYVKASEQLINKNKWSYINIISGMNEKIKSNHILLVDILSNDYLHPNNWGYQLLFEVLYDQLKKQN
ncbi:SGNH/GDSL hydrolase family protein [Bacillus massilinigeriensis]|uniref:SGNH/GDSL hydrolase family protein n=1 Tax=Bacillus massilionigeriensis TaxID=1805475 RepID=UPI00096B33CF|nr:SGNH/GDSL hydrolase family protein [Bacillus massilionigeriensis]